MNIGIITFNTNFSNFGASMQALALRRKLVSMGHNVYHIVRGRTFQEPKDVKESATFLFNKEHLNYLMIDQKEELSRLDAIIYGSDQIWSQSLTKLNPYFFGSLEKLGNPNVMKISYAASLGATNFEDEETKSFMKEQLSSFAHISLREDIHKSTLESLTEKPISIVLDPSLLLDRYAYSDFTTKYNPYGQDYLYVHLHWHHGKDTLLVDYAKKLSSLLNLPIVHNIKDAMFENQVGTTRNDGPNGVVNAICHSKYVLTQSFHGTAFALIYEKPFLVLGHGNNLDSRVESLLTNLGIHERFICRNLKNFSIHTTFKEIDYPAVFSRLEEMKQYSTNYLTQSLNSIDKPKKRIDYLTTGVEFYCYGCGACTEICPINAVELKQNQEGFWFPKFKKNCVKCGFCSEVCPHNIKPNLPHYDPKAYLTFSKDEEVHRNSSSGGMFMTFAKEIIKREGYVVGVGTTDVIRAVYDIVDTEEGAKGFRYSKYVEPEHNDIYKKALDALETNKPVLFTGTPCKIAGLKAFLGRDYDNLYTVEILCKGYPSALALKKYVEFKEKWRKDKIVYFQFRSNRAPAKQAAIEMHFADGKVEMGWKHKHSYMRAFSGNWALRKSCYSCEFKMNNSVADVTIGDAWGLEKFYEKEVPEGLSCLKTNTTKGNTLYESIKNTIFSREVTIEEMFKKNVKGPVPWKPLRSEFYSALGKENIQRLVERFAELEKK